MALRPTRSQFSGKGFCIRNRRMNMGWIIARRELQEEFLVLIDNVVPGEIRTNAIWRAPAVLRSHSCIVVDVLQLTLKILHCSLKQNSTVAHRLIVEESIKRQDHIPITERLDERWINPA